MTRLPMQPLALACLLASSALVQAAQEQTPSTLDTLVVTAKGYASDSHNTPLAIEVLTPSAVQTGPAGNLLRGQPGLALESDGAWGQNPVLRGLSKESVVVMVDGVRMNSAQPQGALASFMDMGLLEQVEVVKGPSSVLYGSGAMGGVVNMRTPEPKFTEQAELGGRFGVSGSSVDKAVAGALLLNASNSEHGLVIGIAKRDADDYKSPHGRVDNTGYESSTALIKYQYKLAEGYKLRAYGQVHQDEDVWYPGSTKPGAQPPFDDMTIHSPEQNREFYGVGLDASVLFGTWSTDVYRQQIDREIRAWSSGFKRNMVENDVSFTTNGLRSQWNGAVASHWLTVGGEYWQMKGDPERYNYQPQGMPPSGFIASRTDPFQKGELTSYGLYVQDEFRLGATELTAGLRYDHNQGTAAQKGVGPAAQTTGLTREDDTVSWSLGALQPLTDSINLYANIGQAYRAPDMRERFEDAARGDGFFHMGNPQLKTERSTSYELGLKGRNGQQNYQLATFYTQIDDFIAGRITGQNHPQNGQPIKRTENLDKVLIYGLEGRLEQPVGAFMLDAGFTWLKTKNKQDDEPLYQTPANEIRVGFGQPADLGVSWHLGVRAVAKQDDVATVFSNGTENATAGFVTADAAIGYGFGAMVGLSASRLDLQLNNLADATYHEHLTEGVSGEEIKAPGRSAVLAFSGSF